MVGQIVQHIAIPFESAVQNSMMLPISLTSPAYGTLSRAKPNFWDRPPTHQHNTTHQQMRVYAVGTRCGIRVGQALRNLRL